MGAYQTAKFAVEGFSEVLANEVKPLVLTSSSSNQVDSGRTAVVRIGPHFTGRTAPLRPRSTGFRAPPQRGPVAADRPAV